MSRYPDLHHHGAPTIPTQHVAVAHALDSQLPTPNAQLTPKKHIRGVAIVEAVVFILIIGVAAASVITLSGDAQRNSVQLLMARQALSIAESQLAVVRALPFTNLDPSTSQVESLATPGPEAGETYNGPARFDNVNDYNGFVLGPGSVISLDGTPMDFGPYVATIQVQAVPSGGPNWNGIPVGSVALITVTVTTPGPAAGVSAILKAPVVLQGLRTRYAPIQGPAP